MNSHAISETTSEECNLCFIFHPRWARFLANRRVFAIIYGFLCLLDGMRFLYVITTLTSMELHFQLPNETFGFILSFGEVSMVVVSLSAGLLVGTNSHRPRAIGISLIVISLGFYLYALPYFLYGSPTPFETTYNDSTNDSDILLCLGNSSSMQKNESNSKCSTPLLKAPEVSVGGITALLFLGYTITNTGSIAVNVVGTPFMDDNVQSKDSPMYLAIMRSVRTLGCVLGTLLSSACLALYVDPQNPPSFDASDVRWVGAWWIGYVVIGTSILIGAIAVMQFPRRLPTKKSTPAMIMKAKEMEPMTGDAAQVDYENIKKCSKLPSAKEMLVNLRRLLSNPLLWFHMLSGTFCILGLEGYMTYLPKYLEHEFQMTSSQAGLWTGCSFIIPTLIAHLATGYLITRFKLNIQHLALAIVIAKLIECSSMILRMFIRCDDSYLLGSGSSEPVCGLSNITNCDCSSAILSPVCGHDGLSYFSACHAGCSELGSFGQNGVFILNNCSCISGNGIAESRMCNTGCSSKYIYLIIVALSKLGVSIDEVVGTLFMLRCVEPRDKTLAGGFKDAFFAVTACIPFPLIYSAFVDWSCLIWSKQCGRQGACDVYDMSKLRSTLHLLPTGFLFISAFWDGLFWYYGKNKVSLYTDEIEIADQNAVKS